MSKTSGKTTGRRPAGKTARPGSGLDRRRAERAAAQVHRERGGGISRGTFIGGIVGAVIAVLVLFLVYQSSQPEPGGGNAGGSASGFKHVAGEPGIGGKAPEFTLTASTGKEVNLGDYRGKSVLLYFQEGLMCQPCWDQITDLEANKAALRKAGVDQVLSISHDPAGHLARKVADEGLSTPALSDPTQATIRAYDAHKYGMMQESTAGHSFILVGPDGTIQWRADYGGAPDYTMFLPTEKMLADLAKERAK
ncbi:MAG: peroxiredoxin family protein [Thermocrispum sp.]